jgi:hypothetical protein
VVDGEVLATMSALIRSERPFEREAVARFFGERGWLVVSSYPIPCAWEYKGVDVLYRPGETDADTSIDFVLHEESADWGPLEPDEQLAELGNVLAEVTAQLLTGLSGTFPVTEDAEAASGETELFDVRRFQVGSLFLSTGIYLGDGPLPTMVIAQLVPE